MKYAQIIGWGKYVPARIVTNDELALTLATSDSWIRERTGIGARRVAADNESTSTMATQAAINAFDAAGINASQLDLIIVATSTPENFFPSVACLVQDALGADKAGSYDLSAACSGFVYALSNATDAIKSGSAQYVTSPGRSAPMVCAKPSDISVKRRLVMRAALGNPVVPEVNM
jgi:3-oxoacyl-[acyl-carrier-protein] synthase-3